MSYDGSHLGYDCGGARFGGASSLHGLPALGVLFTLEGEHEVPRDYGKRWIVGCGCKKPLTQFVHWGGERLAGFGDGVIALDSVGPTGACVGEPACSHCRRGATEGDKDYFYNLRKSKKFQPSEDSAYLTLQHSRDISRAYWTTGPPS